jgi:hypothetical protein
MEDVILSYVVGHLNQQIICGSTQKIYAVRNNGELTDAQKFGPLTLLTTARTLSKKSSLLIGQLADQKLILNYTVGSYRLYCTARYSGQVIALTEESFTTRLDEAWELNYLNIKEQRPSVEHLQPNDLLRIFWETFDKLNNLEYPNYQYPN